jgi:hypothetical protein
MRHFLSKYILAFGIINFPTASSVGLLSDTMMLVKDFRFRHYISSIFQIIANSGTVNILHVW